MTDQPLDFDHPPTDPVALARNWFACADRESGLPNPNAMTLATVGENGQPSARIVLLKGFDERGAVFFTNRQSMKGRELAANPHAALVFHWDPLERQIRITGRVEVLSSEEDDAYFASRGRGSRIGAWASQQSAELSSRSELEERVREFETRFADGEVPRPPHWGGFRVSLDSIEFWQGLPSRLHDRVVYIANDEGWTTRRMQP